MENFKQINLRKFQNKKGISNWSSSGMGCPCCGKDIENEKYFIHYLTNGNIINTDEDQGDDDQGSFPIGSVCRKKFPKDFIFTDND